MYAVLKSIEILICPRSTDSLINSLAPINETIYLLPTEGMDCPQGHVYQLGKALYGRSWNSILTELLISNRLTQCISDTCIFVAHSGELMVIVYVDDVIVSSLNKSVGEKTPRRNGERI